MTQPYQYPQFGPPTGPDPLGQLKAEVQRLRMITALVAFVAVVALAVAGLALFRPQSPLTSSPEANPAATASVAPEATSSGSAAKPKPADAGTAPAGTIVLGNPGKDLPVVDVYEDFQCPACAQAEKYFGEEVNGLVKSGTVEVRYHMMSFLDEMLHNDSSARAANGGFCAQDQNKFLDWHDVLFSNQPAKEGDGWTDDQLKGLAAKAGLDVTAWQSCLASGKHSADVKNANDLSAKAGVSSTPTFKLNGATLSLQAAANAGGLTPIIDAAR